MSVWNIRRGGCPRFQVCVAQRCRVWMKASVCYNEAMQQRKDCTTTKWLQSHAHMQELTRKWQQLILIIFLTMSSQLCPSLFMTRLLSRDVFTFYRYSPSFGSPFVLAVLLCVTAKRKERRKATGKTRKEYRKEEGHLERKPLEGEVLLSWPRLLGSSQEQWSWYGLAISWPLQSPKPVYWHHQKFSDCLVPEFREI